MVKVAANCSCNSNKLMAFVKFVNRLANHFKGTPAHNSNAFETTFSACLTPGCYMWTRPPTNRPIIQ